MSVSEIKKYLGKEVFVVANDGDVDVGDIGIFETLKDLNEHLSYLNPIAEDNVTVVHGIITSAEYIPDDIGDGAYVLAVDSEDPEVGAIFEISDADPGQIADLVETLVGGDNGGSIYSAANDLSGTSIDHVFIIYGYEMTLSFNVNEDEVDEHILEECRKIVNTEKKMGKTTGESEG